MEVHAFIEGLGIKSQIASTQYMWPSIDTIFGFLWTHPLPMLLPDFLGGDWFLYHANIKWARWWRRVAWIFQSQLQEWHLNLQSQVWERSDLWMTIGYDHHIPFFTWIQFLSDGSDTRRIFSGAGLLISSTWMPWLQTWAVSMAWSTVIWQITSTFCWHVSAGKP